MGPLGLLWHLMGLLAPAAAVALLVSLFGRFLLPKTAGARSWSVCLAIDFIAGSAVLLAGLWWFGRDGKMLTYAGMVLACATSQWLAAKGSRR